MRTLMSRVVVMAVSMIVGGGTTFAAGEKVPEAGTWQYQQALETGTLSASDSLGARKDVGRPEAPVPTIEAGGVVYRVGIDTN